MGVCATSLSRLDQTEPMSCIDSPHKGQAYRPCFSMVV